MISTAAYHQKAYELLWLTLREHIYMLWNPYSRHILKKFSKFCNVVERMETKKMEKYDEM